MKTKLTSLVVLSSLLAVSACGESTGDRAVSGAGIGAGAGALGAAVLGGNPVGAAVIGGVGGGAVGALTSPSQVDLGKPAWR